MTDTNDIARLRALLDAYGGAAKRWPEADRAWAQRLVAASAEAARLQREARALDARLDEAALAPAAPGLMAAVLSGTQTQRGAWLAQLWPFGPLWRPATALAAACVLGIAVGLTTPTPEALDSAPGTEITADLEILNLGPYAFAESL